MTKIHPSLLAKHFAPDRTGTQTATADRNTPRFVLPLDDPHLQHAAGEARNYFNRVSAPRSDCGADSRLRS